MKPIPVSLRVAKNRSSRRLLQATRLTPTSLLQRPRSRKVVPSNSIIPSRTKTCSAQQSGDQCKVASSVRCMAASSISLPEPRSRCRDRGGTRLRREGREWHSVRRRPRQRARSHERLSVMSVGLDTIGTDEAVIGVIKIKVDAADVSELLAEGTAVLSAESRDLPGFLAAQILVSVDNRTIVILTEWSDRHAWSQSRYDVRVGEMTERLYIKSTIIEFETYTRRANFARTTIK